MTGPAPATAIRTGPHPFSRSRASALAGVAVAMAGGVLWASPALPADPATELRTIEERLQAERQAQDALREKREALAAELRQVRDQVIESAAAVQDSEENLSRLEGRLSALREERALVSAALSMRDTQMTHVLTAIQRLAWRPTEALIVQPAPPADTVRSAILLGAAIPRIQENARALASELETLHGLDAAITAQLAEIADEAEALRVAHARLQALFDRKAALQRHTREQEREAALRVERLGREADDLRDLIHRLEEERKRREALAALKRAEDARRQAQAEAEARRRAAEAAAAARAAETATASDDPPAPETPAPEAPLTAAVPASTITAANVPLPPPAPPRTFSTGRGLMPMPVRGEVLTRYGEPDPVGSSSKGVTIRTRDGAQVVAPYDGTVAFAGPFRGYGLLLIIEHTDGYHSLLAGMERLDGHVGQAVRAGEPIGVMGRDAPSLYLELRRDGRPINPLPWMAAGTDTGKG
ncbi:murein hydrolase activator EnvC family protein [Roseospira navarrensis]|uniref:Peptidoglycan DD-metalloendopeptidase family protein n=1 Tax=Roseospira navarrensis TaxID=140058 RepID=A0A7X1ZGD2_9PROT|nr:peptidoglycan DD-metalloendopeptidase family protein [Roseospira navarrensis]MQX37519.1 peptidoglycan DD-metalloendopeptidase family protein [Roseospira navarrensis]